MIYIYNEATDTYTDLYRQAFENLEEYLGEEVADTTIYKIMFFASLQEIFDQAKKRSSFRGRFAKDGNGVSLLENIMITDDEQSFIEDMLPAGATELFKKLSAWMKNDNESYQFRVSFGAKAPMGTVTADSGTTITDSTGPFAAGTLEGFKIVILSGDIKDEEREILSNTATDLTIERPFTSSSLGLSYGVYNPDEKFVTYALEMDLNWNFAMIQAVEAAIKEALITFELKEWYLANRFMEDYTIEEAKYQRELGKARSALMQGKHAYRRPTDFFSLGDY